MTSTVIEVAAGIIYNTDQSEVLLTLRKPDQHQGNCWEFPGGKIDQTETVSEALERELHEELGIRVTQCEPFCQIEHAYTDKSVHLHFWQVTAFDGEPVGLEGQQFAWVSISELSQLEFPEANTPVVEQLTGGT